MIHLIDDALERFLKHEVLEESSIEVSFNRPDGEWVSSLTSPVINIFLWRIRKDHVKNSSGTEVRSGNESLQLPLEFWQAIGGDLKSGIDLEISVPIDLELGVEVGPPVEGIELRTEDIHSPTIKSVRSYVRGESNDG